jgi:hypothetical protein
VYSILANACWQLSTKEVDAVADYHHNLSMAFSNMMLRTLSTYPLFSVASLDAAESLVVAVSYSTLEKGPKVLGF